jgi:hypothetical protein
MSKNNLNHQFEEREYPPLSQTLDKPEVHYVRADRSGRNRGKALLYGSMIAVSAALCIFLYLSRSPRDGTIPVIKAENGTIKIRPQEQEAQIPHSEKTIYGELAPSEAKPKVENLLAEPEKPQPQTPTLPDEFMKALGDPEDNTAELADSTSIPSAPLMAPTEETTTSSNENMSGQVDDATEEPVDNLSASASPALATQEDPVSSVAVSENPAPEKAPTDMEVSKIEVKSSKIASSKTSANKVGASERFYRVQIYSAASQKMAEQQWDKFRKKSGGLLAPYSPVIQRIDLGANVGIRYRLQVGQFSKSAAQSFCSSLKKKGIDCWAVRQ